LSVGNFAEVFFLINQATNNISPAPSIRLTNENHKVPPNVEELNLVTSSAFTLLKEKMMAMQKIALKR